MTTAQSLSGKRLFTARFHNLAKISSKRLSIAITVSVAIIILDYFFGNFTYPVFDSSADLGLPAFIKDFHHPGDDEEEYYAVNTAHDTALAYAINSENDTTGMVPVSDRLKLVEFLKTAAKSDYRYIFIDIRFDADVFHPDDSLLFAQISKMPRTLFSRHRTDQATEEEREKEAGKLNGVEPFAVYADYRTLLSDGFSRYEFIQDGNESAALRMYEDLDGRTIKATWWGGYADSDGSTCRNMQFIPFPKSAVKDKEKDMDIKYPYLSYNVLGMNSEQDLIKQLKDKIIIIGNFDEDLHDTYIGEVPGPMLHYHAYRMLQNGGHKINWWLQLLLFLFYTVAISCIITPLPEYKPKSVLMVIVKSLIGWGLTFYIMRSVIYWIFGLSYQFLIPTFIFTVITLLMTVIRSDAFKKRAMQRSKKRERKRNAHGSGEACAQ